MFPRSILKYQTARTIGLRILLLRKAGRNLLPFRTNFQAAFELHIDQPQPLSAVAPSARVKSTEDTKVDEQLKPTVLSVGAN